MPEEGVGTREYIIPFPTTVNCSTWCLSHSKSGSLEFIRLGKKKKCVTSQKTSRAHLKQAMEVTAASAVSGLQYNASQLSLSWASSGPKDLQF